MRRRNNQSIAEILQELLKNQHLDVKLFEVRVIEAWPEIVGKNIAGQTENLFIKNKTLFVHIKSPIVRNELIFMKDNLIKKLNSTAGKDVIVQIRFN